MMNKSNHDELVSRMLDGEMSDMQLDALLARLKSDDGKQIKEAWDNYHLLGDVLRSDDLAVSFSPDFSAKMAASLVAEPILIAPKALILASDDANRLQKSRYWALTSVAATVMLGFLMAPQIIPLLPSTAAVDSSMAKLEQTEQFAAPGVKLATNSNLNTSQISKDAEFAPKLENQVEMLRDPRLDSYLLAHQKVSPSLDNGTRYIQRANVVSSTEAEK
jgi:sigma-E factor negative regulatory protein RseA